MGSWEMTVNKVLLLVLSLALAYLLAAVGALARLCLMHSGLVGEIYLPAFRLFAPVLGIMFLASSFMYPRAERKKKLTFPQIERIWRFRLASFILLAISAGLWGANLSLLPWEQGWLTCAYLALGVVNFFQLKAAM